MARPGSLDDSEPDRPIRSSCHPRPAPRRGPILVLPRSAAHPTSFDGEESCAGTATRSRPRQPSRLAHRARRADVAGTGRSDDVNAPGRRDKISTSVHLICSVRRRQRRPRPGRARSGEQIIAPLRIQRNRYDRSLPRRLQDAGRRRSLVSLHKHVYMRDRHFFRKGNSAS
jgi:hypothetical protein